MDREQVIKMLKFLKWVDEQMEYNVHLAREIEDNYYTLNKGAGLDGMPTAQHRISSPTEMAVVNIPETVSDSLRRYEKTNELYRRLKAAITHELHRLPYLQHKVIFDFYVRGRGWANISSELHYSDRQCQNIRDAALDRLSGYFASNELIADYENDYFPA